ncbi:MAG: histidine ammonia-lyase [Saprospiraceae bacterium]|nr:histidine ammonia-lyase [Saprospiraceae bacterium]
MKPTHYISSTPLSLQNWENIIDNGAVLALSQESMANLSRCRTYLEQKINKKDAIYYGINTGFGSLCNIQINHDQIHDLQLNLVQSHACGTGDEVPEEIVKLMLLLKVQSLAHGYSGVRPELVERLIHFYNYEVYPVIYQQGSLGASGDLAPLAHLSLPLLGLGEVRYKGHLAKAKDVLDELGLKPMTLEAKEGLALLNGTQFSTAYGLWALLESWRLWETANLISAVSLDAFDCKTEPFTAQLHDIRRQPGQIAVAKSIRAFLSGSEIAGREKVAVQDPYAFRCIPQVHGASWAALQHVTEVLTNETNAVTDNPNIFEAEDMIVSGGNFHAQPVALVLDYLAIAMSEMASISERRTYQLISGQRGLPAFLIDEPGLHSGLMIPQYTAASIVSQNKQLCSPASVDSIVSSNGQEDHVSMAANAATKLYRVVKNVERVLAIEWMTAAQAMEFRRPMKSSAKIEAIMERYRASIPKLEADRMQYLDIRETINFLRKGL